MPLDPAISLQGTQVQIPGPLDSASKMMMLKHLISQDQMNQMTMQEAQRKLGGEMTLADLMRKAYTPQQTSTPQFGATQSGGSLPNITQTVPGSGDLSGVPAGLAQAGYGNMVPAYQQSIIKMQAEQAGLGKTLEEQKKLQLENFNSKADILAREVNPLLKQKEITPDNIISTLTNLSRQGFDTSKVELPKDTNPDTLRAWAQHASDSAISMKDQTTNALKIREQNLATARDVTKVPIMDSQGNPSGGYRYVTTAEAGAKGLKAAPASGEPGSPQALNLARDNFTKDMAPIQDLALGVRELEQLTQQPQSPARDLAIRNAMGALTKAGQRGEYTVSQWKNVGGLSDRLLGMLNQFGTGENLDKQIIGIAQVVKTYDNKVVAPLIQQTKDYHSKIAQPRYGVSPEDVIGGWQANVLNNPNRPPLDSFKR